ncbi:MAG TPA: lipoate--protein ligase family protein [Verrucomicrobiae bacterium]|nr:lipoate--protein ligase family protein [Verrucomicrobiae bacterium]
MKYLDLSFACPEDNLAADDALLHASENGAEDVLRFWESEHVFVVVGYGNAVSAEVNVEACRSRGIPILRRCTGGGTVVQGPGCLNYSLIFRAPDEGPLRNITSTNRHIMDRIRDALAAAGAGQVEVLGHTDLAIGGVKFSGNAQRRQRSSILFHGAFLLDFDLSLITEFLPMPSRQPDYREGRSHAEFLRNLNIPAEAVKAAIRSHWGARDSARDFPHALMKQLAREKYARPDWNCKF